MVGAVLTFPIVAVAPGTGAQVAQPAAPSCDDACLSRAMADFVNAMTSRTPASVRLSDAAEIRENARVVPLEGTAWQQVKSVLWRFATACYGFRLPLRGQPLNFDRVTSVDRCKSR